jgi:ADP-heptose:LPS heptosyltransferase
MVIICYHKIGDTVFTIPTIDKIIKSYRHKIYLFCLVQSVAIYKHVFNDLVEYVAFQEEEFLLGERIAKFQVRKKFKNVDPHVVIDLTGSPRSVTTFMYNRSKDIIGFNQNIFKSFYTIFNTIDNFNHVLQIYAKAVRGYIEIDQKNLEQNFHIEAKQSGPILIHPFAGWGAKEWGLKKFVNLAQQLSKIKECKLLIPADSITEEIKKEILASGIEIIETNSIEDLLEQLKYAALVVGNDSGTVYISNLLNVPTFTLFGPSNPSFHFLPSKNSDFIRKLIPCSPSENEKVCFTNGGRDGCPSNLCMQHLEFDEVYKKIVTLLKNYH